MPTDEEARQFSERAAAAAAAATRAGATAPPAPAAPTPAATPAATPPQAADTGASLPGGAPPPLVLPPVTVTAVAPPRPRRAPATQAAPRVVSRETVPPYQAPPDALQTAKPVNSDLPDAYIFTARVLADGADIGPPLAFEVSSNGYYQADRYYVELAASALPPKYQEAYWSGGPQKKIEIRCGISGRKPKSLITGLIDDCEIDWLRRVIRLRGRDLTSLLIDNKTAEKFPNKTAAQVAEIIATRRGLSSHVTPTSALVGTYFQREHARLTTDVSEHDLLTFLAEQEGFNYWVEGSTLHFEQPPPEKTSPFVVTYRQPTPSSIASGSFIELICRRNETLAKDIVVRVISWNGKHKKKIEAVAKRTRTRNSSSVTRNTGGSGEAAQPYIYRIPGLTQEQAQARANQLAAEISKHERSVRVEMPFDPVLDARTRLSLRGTKTEFDQAYYIDSIEYSGSSERGSRMEIHAKNNSPQSQVML